MIGPRAEPEQRPNVLLTTSQALLRHTVGEALEQTGRVQVVATSAHERIARGGVAIPEGMERTLLESLVHRRTQGEQKDTLLMQLTPREREVLLLLAEGASSARIAERLVITKETARKHTQNVLVKMGVRSRLAAVAYVMQGDRLELLRPADTVDRGRIDVSTSA